MSLSSASHSNPISLNSKAMLVNRSWLAFLAILILPLSGLSIDIYVPSLPAVTHYFHVDKSLVQLTITAYMVGIGVMQFFAGSISDTFGRRVPFLLAMLVYIAVTFLIPFSGGIQQLLFYRLIQGVSAEVIIVPMRSVISDLYQGREYFKMVTYMTMAWSIGCIIAPAIGGYLQHYFGWQANFYFLGFYSLVSLLLNYCFLPDTSHYHHPFRINEIFVRCKEIMSHKVFVSALLMNSLIYSMIILFAVVSPFLIQNVLRFTAMEFGTAVLLTGLAWFMGSMISRFILHISYESKAQFCLWAMLVIVIGTLLIEFVVPLNIYLVVAPVALLLMVGGIIFPNNFARAISLFPKTTGSANALFGGSIFLLTGISSGIGVLLKSTQLLPLTSAYLGIIILCLLIYYVFNRG